MNLTTEFQSTWNKTDGNKRKNKQKKQDTPSPPQHSFGFKLSLKYSFTGLNHIPEICWYFSRLKNTFNQTNTVKQSSINENK